ncbi:hypothetical protein ACFL96_13795 [Thermoproteota archaeon]
MVFLTYVGSFPLENTYTNLIKATHDILSIPVDYPNYVQLDNMVNQFLQPIAELGLGIICEGKKYKLNGKLSTPKDPIAIDSLKILLEMKDNHPNKQNIKGIKACVTGPFTLSSQILLKSPVPGFFGETALSDPSLVMEIANIVSNIVKDYRQMGADYVTIDEPILSVIIGRNILLNQYSDIKIIEIINQSMKHIECLNGIHVCGKISRRLVETLLQTDLNILDHEFKDNESNFNVYKKSDFEKYNKKIGFSVASSKKMDVESVIDIELMLNKGIETFGKENILMVKPDCGFRGLNEHGNLKSDAYTSSIAKLKNIRLAIDSLTQKNIL